MIPIQYIPQGCLRCASQILLLSKKEKAVVDPENKDKVIIYGFTADVWNAGDRRGRAVACVFLYQPGPSSLS